MSEHKPNEPWCDCEPCREMTPLQLRQAWNRAENELASARRLLDAVKEHVSSLVECAFETRLRGNKDRVTP